jgi:hypothetical protein
MRVAVEVGRREGVRDEAGLEGGLVQPPPAEEARALDHVELAQLRSEDVDDAQAGRMPDTLRARA